MHIEGKNTRLQMFLLILLIINVILVNSKVQYLKYKTDNTGTTPMSSADEMYLSKMCSTKFHTRNTSCHALKTKNDVMSVDKMDLPFPEDSIFFIETSCNGVLNFRQACSVEAAARAHPHRNINLLFAGPVTLECLHTSPMWEMTSYENVNIYRVHIVNYVKNTPLEKVIKHKVLPKNMFPVHNTADILKVVTLHKYGGVYLDLDVIVTKPLDFLSESKNFVGREDMDSLGSALLALSKNGIGHKISHAMLTQLRDKFNTYALGYSSIELIVSKTLQKFCNVSEITKMTAAACEGFEVYHPLYFYPIKFQDWKKYFRKHKGQMPQEPYAFHLWNSLSHSEYIYEDSLYALLMKFYCPRVLKAMK